MTKLSVFALALTVLVASSASAQAPPTDHWATKKECVGAISAPFYHPHVVSNAPVPKGQVILPHPTGGCFEISLPDRITEGFPKRDRGWVRIETGREFVFDEKDGRQPLRLARCDNVVFDQEPFDTGAVDPNPFAYREVTKVDGPSVVAPDDRNLKKMQSLLNEEEKRLQKAREDWDKLQRRAQADADRSPSHGNFFSLDRGTGKVFWFVAVPTAAIVGAVAYHGWVSGDMNQCIGSLCQSR